MFALLERQATASPEAPFLVFENEAGAVTRRSYGAQLARATAVAALLAGRGVRVGDRVHLMTANRPEFLDVLFGCAALGATVVPVNPLSTPAEVAQQVEDARAVLSVTGPGVRDVVAAAANGIPVLTAEEIAIAPHAAPPAAARTGPGPAAILFTSGTTSRPKGVRVTHANYLRVGAALRDHLGVGPDDRWLVTLPLFHANAQYYCLMSALTAGGSVALTARFSASRWPRQARILGATLASLFAAPIRLVLARAEPGPEDARNDLRLVLFAQNLSDAEGAEFESRFDVPLVQLYGMTETVLPPFVNPLDERRRRDSIGLPLPGVRTRVVDQSGHPVPVGTPGELQVAGTPGVDLAEGYDTAPSGSDPEGVTPLLRDGWLCTGDLVRLDEQGMAYFVDRAKDMIKRSGENVAATEVERVLLEHPDVADAAVHGIPDPLFDEAIVAHVVTQGGRTPRPDDLVAWCAERLARFKVPSLVVLCDDLPQTSVGKVRKDVLRTETLQNRLSQNQGSARVAGDPRQGGSR
ncbi:hypothetical protein BAY59_10490 [Prauserella coralliicola]|nr:hypothetical protein BAY59_10490 [Prauserella coralliicola]